MGIAHFHNHLLIKAIYYTPKSLVIVNSMENNHSVTIKSHEQNGKKSPLYCPFPAEKIWYHHHRPSTLGKPHMGMGRNPLVHRTRACCTVRAARTLPQPMPREVRRFQAKPGCSANGCERNPLDRVSLFGLNPSFFSTKTVYKQWGFHIYINNKLFL